MAYLLDLERWPRRATFEYFRGYDKPYFNVCAPLEAGPLVELARGVPGTSFFLAYLYLSLRAANEVEPFRYRLSDGRVLVHERIHAGTTLLLEDDRFAFAYFDYTEDFARFQAEARAAMARVRAEGGFDAQDDRNDLIHYSTLPWISFTSFSHARNWGKEDSVPKIVFGKCAERQGQWFLPVSVEVHHALMDGLHVGRYLEKLQSYFLEPTAGLGLSMPSR
ncbi:MAG TPA: chloramphenicol acetyltransferase [Thermoanaerobaculia bacterium]|nr:chloramphenicol acetyltransferase [Thermoanaerobaculia bacterium]